MDMKHMKNNIDKRIFMHSLGNDEKNTVISEITHSVASSFDFFLLVVLSCTIATLGLITNSPAVIIGAMLVAPLMSPIIGIGMASITGDIFLWRRSLFTLFGGAILAIILSSMLTLINSRLPFFVVQELPNEVLIRTHPSPVDLLIALAGGLAASYAMTRPNISVTLPGVAIATALMPPLCTVGIGVALSRPDVASGAFLLFITNAITIAFAGAFIFFLRGFSPETHMINHHLPRSLFISAISTLILLIPLTYYSVQFFQQANENLRINRVVAEQVQQLNAELVDLNMKYLSTGLDMVITIRVTSPMSYSNVVVLQKGIVDTLNRSVSLKVNQILAKQFDPLIPPTPTITQTYTPTPTSTHTITSTPTNTPSPTPTSTHTPTQEPTVTLTGYPTATLTSTSTPALVQVLSSNLPRLQIYRYPGGPVLKQIRWKQTLTLLYGKQEFGGLIWVEVMESEGLVGWIPELYLNIVTPTPNE
jgi:uncharacterized hydrophobic protein (TIGR00271 family)